VEELDAMAAEGKAFVVQQEKFVHPMLMNKTMVTREECNRVSAMPQLSLLSVDMEGARMIKETGMDCMMIFIGPETVEFFKDRLFSYLLPTEEQVRLCNTLRTPNRILETRPKVEISGKIKVDGRSSCSELKSDLS
jgi:guanylate kinase